MTTARPLAVAAALACLALAPARADIVWQFKLPGASDTVTIVTDGDGSGGIPVNVKYNVLDVIISASSVFGGSVVGYSLKGGELKLGTNGGGSPNGNFLYWHGAGNRFEINDGDANVNGTYGSGSWMDIDFINPAALGLGQGSGYEIYTWFGGGPNQMFAVKNGAYTGGALDASALTPTSATVSEPASLLLTAASIAALAALGRRRPRRATGALIAA